MPLFKAISSVKDKFTLTPNELLLKDITSNEDVSVPNTVLHQAADLSFQPSDYSKVMETVWNNLRAPRAEWRRIQKTLLLADILMKFGSARCVQELRDYVDRLRPLHEFRYSDEDGDRGAIIREKAKYLTEVLQDFKRIEVEREIAKKQKNKCVGMSKDEVRRVQYKSNSSYDDVKSESINDRVVRNEREKTVSEPIEEKKIDVQVSRPEVRDTIKAEPVSFPRAPVSSIPVSQGVSIPSPDSLQTAGAYQAYPGNSSAGIYNMTPQAIPIQNYPQVVNFPQPAYLPQVGNGYSGQTFVPQTYPISNSGMPAMYQNMTIYNPGFEYSQLPAQFNPLQPNQIYYQNSSRSNIKHNLSESNQEPVKKTEIKNSDLESMLFNLDGLESSLSKKSNKG